MKAEIINNIYLLTYAMVQSPSWEANWFAASQEIPRISQNPKVHYRTHKRPQPVSILGQPNPVHIPTSHLLEIHIMNNKRHLFYFEHHCTVCNSCFTNSQNINVLFPNIYRQCFTWWAIYNYSTATNIHWLYCLYLYLTTGMDIQDYHAKKHT